MTKTITTAVFDTKPYDRECLSPLHPAPASTGAFGNSV